MTKKPTPIPDFNVKVVLPSGDMHPDWHRFFKELRTAINATIDFIDTPVPVPEVEMDEQWPALIPFPDNKDYVLIQNNDVEREITEIVTDSEGGTCTATFKINSTALGGSANSVSTTEDVQAHSSDNVLGVGDDLILTVSSNSTCIDMRVNVKTTRTIVTS